MLKVKRWNQGQLEKAKIKIKIKNQESETMAKNEDIKGKERGQK